MIDYIMTEEILEAVSRDLLGKEITVRGTVVNRKAGPCLQLGDGTILYVVELDDELDGKEIVVTGTYNIKKLIPDPITKDGEIATGAYGSQEVLENIKIKG